MSAPKGNAYNNKYQSEFAKQAFKLCLLGARDQDLADVFKVNRHTIKNWAKTHLEFGDARKRGKMIADAEVAYALFQRATGMRLTKQKVTQKGEIIEYVEELPADVRAMEHWLGCRQRELWNKNHKVELSGNAENPLVFILAEVAAEAENASPLPSEQ